MISFRNLSVLSCVSALLAIAPLAHADSTVNGYAYYGVVNSGGSQSIPTAIPTQASADASFSVTGANIFNMYAPTNAAPDYTLLGFLTNGTNDLPNGNVVTFATGDSHAGDGLNNTLIVFYGDVTLTGGTTYGLTHDDGVVLYLNGSSTPTINAGGPTSADTSNFSVGSTETVPFILEYAEVDGAPAQLSTTVGLNLLGVNPVTPEPSSFVLLGSGLLAAAGMIRRRMMA